MRSTVSSRVHSSSPSRFELGDRRLGGLAAGVELLALHGAVVLDVRAADQARQRQALPDERHEDHRERRGR